MNNWYVYYDASEKITSVTNELKDAGSYFIVEQSQVIDFLSGKKDFSNHTIRIKNFKEYEINEVALISYKPVFKNIVVLETTENSKELDLAIFYNKNDKQWKFSLNESIRTSALTNQYTKILNFYFCNINDYNCIHRSVTMQLKELIDQDQKFSFLSEHEEDYDNLAVISKKYFDYCGVIHV
jgi:hypothetical protein